MSPDLVIQLVGATVAISCALVGSFLVLRRMALLGDAISHAVLPGIVIAFLVADSRNPIPMLIGAGALGVITVFLIEILNRSGRMHTDASIGVVFPCLFSIGVILASQHAGNIDLDLECVLYGEIAYAPLDTLVIGGKALGARALWVAGAILLMNVVLVTLCYKELKVTSFDPALAATLGISPLVMHYVLMSAVSVTVVGSFESVGAILVVAMLVVPPATAYLLTDRLSRMLALACVFGVGSAVLGYHFATLIDASIAGGMATAAGFLFAVVFVVSPKYGLLRRTFANRELALRFDRQLLLLHLKGRTQPLHDGVVLARFGWSRGRLERIAKRLVHEGSITEGNEGYRITAVGENVLEATGTAPLAHPA